MLTFRNVTKTYGQGTREVVALRNVDMQVDPGEFIAITGPSGGGKSTLLHLACGLDVPTDGEVIVDGRSTTSRTDDELTLMRRDRIGLIFQAFNLIPTLTALENVVLPTTLAGRSFTSQLSQGQELLARVDLEDRVDHYPDQLSGGQTQRVAIARALVMNPQILLADEPTGNLDTESGQAIMDLLLAFGLGEGSRSTMIVTHDEALAARAPRRVRIRDGRLV